MKKTEFEKIKERHEASKARLKSIFIGDMVWEEVARGGLEADYHPAMVKEVNVDENCVDVIDVSDNNKEKRYVGFLTEYELMHKLSLPRESIEKDREKYADVISSVKQTSSVLSEEAISEYRTFMQNL